jgi:hypothetical protein
LEIVISFATFLDLRGFDSPDVSYAKWKQLSAGLNARPDLAKVEQYIRWRELRKLKSQ